MMVHLTEPITLNDSDEEILAVILTPSIFKKLLNLSRGAYYIIFIQCIMYNESFISITCKVYKHINLCVIFYDKLTVLAT